MTTKRQLIRRPSGRPAEHAAAIANAAETVWRQDYTNDSRYVPVAVVAALSLTAICDDPHEDSELILSLPDAMFLDYLHQVWHCFAAVRPDLAVHTAPLFDWLHTKPSREVARMAVNVGHAALRAGQLHLTATENRWHADILGDLLQRVRNSKSARAGLGQFYTPTDVAQVIAEMLFGLSAAGLAPGESIMEPAAGTGGMLGQAALVLRDRGHDPADFHWYANDIDPIAVACLAVNCYTWGLGRNVFLSCGDILADPTLPDKARRSQLKPAFPVLFPKADVHAELVADVMQVLR